MKLSELHSEVQSIWRSRDNELPPCEPHGWSWEQTTEVDIETVDLAVKIIAVAKLTENEARVIVLRIIYGATLDEVGKQLGRTREQVRQMEARALRKLRRTQERITGIRANQIWCENTTWARWKSMTGRGVSLNRVQIQSVAPFDKDCSFAL